MKNAVLITSSILFCLLLFACQQETAPHLQQVEKEIDAVHHLYVQDKRTALFEVKPRLSAGNTIVLTGETIFPAAKKQLLERLSASELTIVDSILELPSPSLSGKIYGLVNLSVCNIRSEPRHSAELATQALLGTPLRVYHKAGGFYYIQTPDNYLGWVDGGGLVLLDSTEFAAWQNTVRVVCLQDYVFAFSAPDKNAGKVTDLLAGNILQLVENQGKFTKIRLPDGRIGFVASEHLLTYREWIDSRKATPDNILATAREMMGRPYLWGGTSGKGMDCSGFTKTVYYLNGIQLERDASLQVHNGLLVETDTTLKNLEPGDLLFFGNYRKDGSERITHVAIYMGDGKIIHASDLVKVESLKRGDDTFVEERLSSFMRARRVIGSEGKNGIIALKDAPFY